MDKAPLKDFSKFIDREIETSVEEQKNSMKNVGSIYKNWFTQILLIGSILQ
jgi:hypothetical protein